MKTLQNIYNSELSKIGKFNNLGEKALSFFREHEFPSRKTEEWKYTDLTPVFTENLQKAKKFEIDDNFFLKYNIPDTKALRLVFVNGHFSEKHSDKLNEENVTISNISHAFNSHESEVKEVFGTTNINQTNNFTALNAAFAEAGTFISVKKNKKIEKPIHLVYLSDGREGASLAQIRNLFVLGENSKATLVESFVSLSNTRVVSNFSTEVFIKEGGNLELYRYQVENEQDFLITNTVVEQAANSQLRSSIFALNGRLIRNDVTVNINGEGAYAEVNGLSLADKRQHFDNAILINHLKPNCNSSQLFKGLIDDEATVVFNGKVFVAQDAQKTNAYQSNKNILLTQTATAHSKPQLEIYADDVACSHGSTTGQLDTEALFYMQTRGLSKQKAKSLLLFAFAADVASKIKNEAVKAWIEDIIDKRLKGRNIVRECKHVYFTDNV